MAKLAHKIIASVLLVLALFILVKLVMTAASGQGNSDKPTVSVKGAHPVEKALERIRDGDMAAAVQVAQTDIIGNATIADEVQDYFDHLQAYYNYRNAPKKTTSAIDTAYFITSSDRLFRFLQGTLKYDKTTASRLVEMVPYYFIKKYDQFEKRKSRLYSDYRRVFTADDGLSEQTADIVCLYVQSAYKENKKDDDTLKGEIAAIEKIQKDFARELQADGGIYEPQSAYLKNVAAYLERQINARFNIILFEPFPAYTIY